MHILVVEDDPRISSLLERGLSEEGHRVSTAADLATGRRLVESVSPDLIVLDRMLGDGDGLDLARELRKKGDRRPILVLTARDRVEERVTGLLDGADDYVVKPFSFEELNARISALARRSLMTTPRIELDDLVIDTEALRVWRSGAEIQLTAQEFKLLRYLAEHAGKVIPRVRLLEHVWDMHHDPGTNVVDVYVSYLRSKIDKGHERALIHTVRGLGYMLEARR